MVIDLEGNSFGLLTLHGKETLIAPLLKEHFNASLILTKAFDTDALGTFSGEVERTLAPYECALKKAHLACEYTGLALGLGSEGSFGPSPYGIGVFNHELIACINADEEWTVIGHYYGFSSVNSESITTTQQLSQFLERKPGNQGLILKSSTQIRKGLYDYRAIISILNEWFEADFAEITTFPEAIIIEYDLRAHHCPERRERIIKATENLIFRLKSLCPKCKTPGFWQNQHVGGLPCVLCNTATPCIKAHVATCAKCHYVETTLTNITYAEPTFCPYCNP